MWVVVAVVVGCGLWPVWVVAGGCGLWPVLVVVAVVDENGEEIIYYFNV